MLKAFRLIGNEIRSRGVRYLVFGAAFAVLFQLLMLIALIVRFQAFPNYIEFYDWFGNAVHIAQSTPSWSDVLSIVWEEWLIEIGQMTHEYGAGLSVWSLNVVPSRLIVLTGMGFLAALCWGLHSRNPSDSIGQRCGLASLGSGAIMVAMTNATMSWVVCCATPSWVVGLAMLGLGVSTSLALESLGPALSIGGFALLAMACLFVAWNRSKAIPSITSEFEYA